MTEKELKRLAGVLAPLQVPKMPLAEPPPVTVAVTNGVIVTLSWNVRILEDSRTRFGGKPIFYGPRSGNTLYLGALFRGGRVMNGQFAALSLDEETTLRRIARGIRNPMALSVSQVGRLQRLGLVAQTRMGLTLTSAGRARLQGRVAGNGEHPDPIEPSPSARL